MKQFALATEARAVDIFWNSRTRGRLVQRPEKTGQALFATFARGALGDRGLVFRELSSGVGFVDIGVVLGRSLHIIEMKLLRSRFTGLAQLQSYMKTENRRTGWLVIFDARSPENKVVVPSKINLAIGRVNVVLVDINPIPPSKRV